MVPADAAPDEHEASAAIRVVVAPLPDWLDWRRLLGDGSWEATAVGPHTVRCEASLSRRAAADVSARLRGLVLAGEHVTCDVTPSLARRLVRQARTQEARRRRETTPGFTRSGVRIDEEGRYSLTPEALALELGARTVVPTVVDAGAGLGGNTIGFARAGSRVIAVERDPERVELLRHNAKIYGVADRVEVVCGDAAEIVAGRRADLVFVDPPWGRNWREEVPTNSSFPLLEAVLRARPRGTPLWAKLPPSAPVPPGARAEAMFGRAPGDDRSVKFILARFEPA